MRVSVGAEDFVAHLQSIHAEVRRQIALHNDRYKLRVDNHKRHVEFQPGDLVLVHLQPERFPKGSIHKLHPRKAGPFKVLKRLGPHAYLLELPANVSYNPIFNVEDLTLYPGHEADPLPDPHTFPAPATIKPRDELEAILDDQLVSTRRGGYQKFLVKWKNRPLSDCCWLQTEEVQRLNPDLYEFYQAQHLSESNTSPGGGN